MFPLEISWRTHPMVFGLAALNLAIYLAVQWIQPSTACFGGLSTYRVFGGRRILAHRKFNVYAL